MSLCSSGGDSRRTRNTQENRAQPPGRRTFPLGWARMHGVSQEPWSLWHELEPEEPCPRGEPLQEGAVGPPEAGAEAEGDRTRI